MGRFKNWLESTAAKRRVNAAAERADRGGSGEKLPPQYANVPGTNVKAHLSLGKNVGDKPVYNKGKKKNSDSDWDLDNLPEHKADPAWMKVDAKKKAKKTKEMAVKEGQSPNRSLDAFALAAEKFKETIPEIMKKAREKEGEHDAKADELSKDSSPSHEEKDDEENGESWKNLKQVAKDRKKDKDSEEESSDSDGAT